jgi:hypothetical protein
MVDSQVVREFAASRQAPTRIELPGDGSPVRRQPIRLAQVVISVRNLLRGLRQLSRQLDQEPGDTLNAEPAVVPRPTGMTKVAMRRCSGELLEQPSAELPGQGDDDARQAALVVHLPDGERFRCPTRRQIR